MCVVLCNPFQGRSGAIRTADHQVAQGVGRAGLLQSMSGRDAGEIDGHLALVCEVGWVCTIISLQLLAQHR